MTSQLVLCMLHGPVEVDRPIFLNTKYISYKKQHVLVPHINSSAWAHACAHSVSLLPLQSIQAALTARHRFRLTSIPNLLCSVSPM